ncbi:uncharacterized protein LOC141685611 [Apium graveolens]|uniref:uncharacterized protein LOC141685611 n=1 Tax=Apium graveolens TaxID=4045 RepID=UPI003D79991F
MTEVELIVDEKSSCLVAAVFLLCIAVAITTVYFLLFKPKHPQITANAVQFPTFTLSNDTVNFTFFQFVTVTNPNRDTFTHYDSSLQLDYSDDQRRVAATVGDGVETTASAAGDVMEIETQMKLVGRVRVLKVFTHRESEGSVGVGRGGVGGAC